MGSQSEMPPPWQSWDSCHVFSARDRRATPLVKTVALENTVSEKLVQTFCRDQQVSEVTLFKLAWCIAVGAYAGVEDVCVGVRSAHGQALLRCRLDPHRPIESLLSSNDEVLLASSSNKQDLAGLAHSSGLFDTILTVKDSQGQGTNDVVSDYIGASLLEAEINVKTGGIVIHYYPSTLVSSSWAMRAATLFSRCIAECASQTKSLLRDVDILPVADAEDIQAWNSKDLGKYDICLHEAIYQKMTEAPDNQAVCAWDGELTYRELDYFASLVARKLHRLGVNTGASVAFLFNKSKWTVVSLLGILKSGGAAVALNPEFPLERNMYILDFTGAGVLLAGRDLENVIDLADTNITKIMVDEVEFPDVSTLSDSEQHFSLSTAQPSDVAYIQFTSGSTGQPKGIMLEHRTYLASAISQHEACHVSSDSRFLQFASHSFDAILVEVLTPLLAGACVCIPSDERRLNDLAGVMRDLRVNWMGVTPTLARELKPSDVSCLQTLCLWGEAATSDIIETWADAVELINIYGPSENSVISTFHSWSRGVRDPSHLGKTLKAVNAWVVRVDNPELLAPIGAIGELALQGPTVAKGYLHDATRNATSFRNYIPWMTPEERNQRIYYSGDLVRYTDDGSLEFWGRRDTQVKIRGHRIELGEIEYNINQSHEGTGMTSVVEVIRPAYRPGQKLLVAFIDEKGNSATSSGLVIQPASDMFREKAAIMESSLGKHLPPHFIPSLYLPLEYMPTLASGKADRRRLRTTVESLSEMELLSYSSHYSSTKAPFTEADMRVARLWAEVLGIEVQKISCEDSFFWLGGNSILAMRLAVAARKQGLSLTVAQILNNPRLEQLGALVASQEYSMYRRVEPPPYRPFSSLSPTFINEFVSGVVAPRLQVGVADVEDVALATDYQIENLAWSSLKSRGGTNYITFDFRNGGVDPKQLQTAIERLVSYHTILRTVYLVHQRHVYQVALKKPQYEIIHCLYAKDVECTRAVIIEIDRFQPVNINWTLIKFWLICDKEGQARCLILRASHLQYDGVSLIRLCKELGLAFSGSALFPAPSFFGYMHFAANHNEEEARSFWRKTLAGSSMTNIFHHTSIPWRHVLDGQVETTIETALVRSHSDITIGTTIKTAWALVLAEMAGSSEVVFGSVIWGRNAMFPEVEHVTGACIDNIPVRVRFEHNMTRLGLLQQVQQQYFEAVSFESFQYKRIVEECTDWRSWERLSTLVEYENLGEETRNFALTPEHHFVVDEERPPADRHDITIYSTPVGEGQTFIALDFCRDLVPKPMAQAMLDRMVEYIRQLHEDVYGTVEVGTAHDTELPRIPMSLPLNTLDSDSDLPDDDTWSTTKHDFSEYQSRMARDIVEEAWVDVLGCEWEDLCDYWERRVPFYEPWGNLIASYGLAEYYRRRGHYYFITVERILENADMQSQVELLLERGR